jgi:hypothetical protein
MPNLGVNHLFGFVGENPPIQGEELPLKMALGS